MDRGQIRIVGISSSPRHANTDTLVLEALAAAKGKYGVGTEFVSFKGKRILGCVDCKACTRRRMPSIQQQCILEDDWQELVTPLVDPVPSGVIIGSPVYFYNVDSQLRAFMERCTSLLKGYWSTDAAHAPPDWSRTVGGAVAVGHHRHGGQEQAISTILHFFLTLGLVAVGSHDQTEGPLGYAGGAAWQGVAGTNAHIGVRRDDWGLRSARAVGEKVAYTAILLATGGL